ncbi:MAG: M61 family metallopeptidase [Planctomycetes bacterium]|nr:M61 family metallopeptidase [Planctomycetota bacterium]
MEFRIDLSAIAQRRLRIQLALEPGPESDFIEFFLPVWTPGSYLIREYSRHILSLDAVDGVRGVGLEVERPAKNRYRVRTPEGCERVVLRYEVYAHSLTVREAWVGEEFAYWNGACAYLWPVGSEASAARIRVELPTGWTLFAGGSVTDGAFEVRDLDHAVDTPCVAAADPVIVEFAALGRQHRFVCAGLAGLAPRESLANDATRIVEAAARVFGGELPFTEYSFLSLFGASGRGGLEHCDCSTLLAPRTTFAEQNDYEDFMSLVAHEFFHVWNVKRMRPKDLMRFDYEREQHTTLLWVAEGVTAYYDDHICLRTGLYSPRRYLDVITGHIRNMRRMPGRLMHSLADASFDAWIRFYRPDENTRNSTQNYYSNGALAAICIDAWIRDATEGARSLDDVMGTLWRETESTGYALEDVLAAIDAAAGETLAADVRSLVEGPFDPDLDGVFRRFGLALDPGDVSAPRLGVQFERGSTKIATVFDGTPAFDAGLAPGDEVLAVDDLRVDAANWTTVFHEAVAPGEPAVILVAREGRVSEFEAVPDHDDVTNLRIVPLPEPSDEQLSLRVGWLGEASRTLR